MTSYRIHFLVAYTVRSSQLKARKHPRQVLQRLGHKRRAHLKASDEERHGAGSL